MNVGPQELPTGLYMGGARVAQATPAGAQIKPATTVYEQAQALTRALLELNPPSRTTAEVVNLLLGSMDPLSRQRTIRALCEVYEAQTTAPGMLGIFP